jgi:hypothetical protein
MLPGFRFLFAAIVFSTSILVFGLGAAALLRAAHERFASNPAWHAAPEATFAQQADVSRPVLAMLRVEPEQKASDAGPSVGVPAPTESEAAVPPAAAPAEPDQIAALKPEQQETSSPEAAKPEPVPESPQTTEAAPARTDAAAATDATRPAAPDAETRVASIEPASPPQLLPPANDVTAVTAGPSASEPSAASAAVETDTAATKIAALGDPAVETAPPAKAAVNAPDRSKIRKQQRARRAARRRRLAARARLAAQQAQSLQQAAAPFAQPAMQPQPYAQPAPAARRR